MKKLKDKVVVITGASSGIGEATALKLASEGAKVVLGARRIDRLEEVRNKINESGGKALALVTDVTNKSDVENLIKASVQSYGRVDVLINNAGIMPLALMKKTRVEEWERTIDVNVKGVLYGVAAALPLFQEQRGGHFINIASVGGRRVYPGCAVYCGSKFAVRAISEGLRLELDPSDNIKVTVIEPGAVRTELPNSIKDEEYLKGFRQFESSFTFLEPEDIAESIYYAVTQADRVNVDEILIMPREQSH